MPNYPASLWTQLVSLRAIRAWGLTAFLALSLASLGPACRGLDPPSTFVYVPADADPGLVLDLKTDICVLYAPPRTWNQTQKEMSLYLAANVRGAGRRVYLVVGHNMNSSDAVGTYETVNGSITDFLPYLSGIIIGDDVMTKGNITTLNTVARWAAGNWSNVLDIGLGLDPQGSALPLAALDLKPYRFICTYYYTQVNITYHYARQLLQNRTPNLVVGHGSDPGRTGKLVEWVRTIKQFSGEHDIDVWFMLAAFSDGDLTSTIGQMEIDLKVAKEAGFEAIGWFTISNVGAKKAAVFVGGGLAAGAYDWLTYGHLKTTLVEEAKRPTTTQLRDEIWLLATEIARLVKSMNETLLQLNATADLTNRSALQLAALDRSLTSLNYTLSRLGDGQTSIASDLDGLRRALTSLEVVVGSLAQGAALRDQYLQDDIDLLAGVVSGMDIRLNSTTDTASEQRVRIDGLNSSIGALGQGISLLADNQASITSTLSGAAQALTLLQEAVENLAGQVATLQQDRDEAQAGLDRLGLDLQGLAERQRRDRARTLLAISILGAVFLAPGLYLSLRGARGRQRGEGSG